MDREIELIKKEYEEKMKRKKKSKDSKEEKNKDKDKDKKDEKKEDDEEKKAEKEKDDKVGVTSIIHEDRGDLRFVQIKAVTGQQNASAADGIPRIYALNKVFYQKRLDRLRNLEIARRNRERLKNPTLFPSVPGGNLD